MPPVLRGTERHVPRASPESDESKAVWFEFRDKAAGNHSEHALEAPQAHPTTLSRNRTEQEDLGLGDEPLSKEGRIHRSWKNTSDVTLFLKRARTRP